VKPLLTSSSRFPVGVRAKTVRREAGLVASLSSRQETRKKRPQMPLHKRTSDLATSKKGRKEGHVTRAKMFVNQKMKKKNMAPLD
jgi:hypothetical protein